MNLDLAYRTTVVPAATRTVDPRIERRIERRAGDCPVHVAQQAARAELMLLHDVRNPAEYEKRLGLDSSNACANVVGWVRAKWTAADQGVPGRGRRLAALDLAANELMLGLVFTGPRSAGKREEIVRRFRQNRRDRDALLDQSPRLQAMEISTAASVTLAPRKFRVQTTQLDAVTIALELMLERRELIQPGADNVLDIVRIVYVEA